MTTIRGRVAILKSVEHPLCNVSRHVIVLPATTPLMTPDHCRWSHRQSKNSQVGVDEGVRWRSGPRIEASLAAGSDVVPLCFRGQPATVPNAKCLRHVPRDAIDGQKPVLSSALLEGGRGST